MIRSVQEISGSTIPGNFLRLPVVHAPDFFSDPLEIKNLVRKPDQNCKWWNSSTAGEVTKAMANTPESLCQPGAYSIGFWH